MIDIPDNHPRADSLRVRHAIIDGMHKKIIAEAGLIAHGRGEAFDYLIGERTHKFAEEAIEAATAMLYLAKKPVISVNGNTCVLCLKEMIEFSKETDIPLEVNLFYRTDERLNAIKELFQKFKFPKILGLEEEYYDTINELEGNRRFVDIRGIKNSDVVVVPLEDGDRTLALVKSGKKVITIDLNPLSRTAQTANITIVDNVNRVFPLLLYYMKKISSRQYAKNILQEFNNKEIISRAMDTMSSFWKKDNRRII